MYLELYILFSVVCTNIHGTLLIWKLWILEKYFCHKKCMQYLRSSYEIESCLYQDSKYWSCHLISWVIIVKRFLEIAGSFISTKLRISLKSVSVKIQILPCPLEWQIPQNLGWRKAWVETSLLAMGSWAEGSPGRWDLASSCLQ